MIFKKQTWLCIFSFHKVPPPSPRKKREDFRLTFIPCCMLGFTHSLFYDSAFLVGDKDNRKCKKRVSCLNSDRAGVFSGSPIQLGLFLAIALRFVYFENDPSGNSYWEVCSPKLKWDEGVTVHVWKCVTWFQKETKKSSDFCARKQHSLCQCFGVFILVVCSILFS